MKALQQQQQVLDDRIHKLLGVTEKDTMEKRITALSVEIAELANEVRFFKYWSVKKPTAERVSDEAADVLHFIFSLANTTSVELQIPAEKDLMSEESYDYLFLSMQKCCYVMLDNVRQKSHTRARLDWTDEGRKDYEVLLDRSFRKQLQEVYKKLTQICHRFGLSLPDLWAAYEIKNTENHERQNNGY